MNHKTLDISLKLFFLVCAALVSADIVNTTIKSKVHVIPSFDPPRRMIKQVRETAPPETGDELVEEAEMPQALPPFRLLGTVIGAYRSAIILNPENNRQEIYRVGNDVGSGWLLLDIKKNKIVLSRGGEKETLEVKFMEASESPAAEPERARSRMRAPAERDNRMKLSRSEVEGALSDLNKVMTQARVVPNMVNNATEGYRIFNIAQGSIYTKLGLVNNDIVERVNGVDINSPDTMYQLFQQIRNERRISIDLKRGGERQSIVVDVR